jgi:ABC-type glycerol-3-phosphate transport system substrate-binding protein
MRRLVALVAVVLLSAVALTACGSSDSSSAKDTSELPTKVIDISVTGSDTTPNGTDIDVKVGQRIELDVTADAPGEIHVHSSPEEQEFEYDKGSSTFDVKPIPAPGQVVVESHTLDKVLFTLVAR